MLSKNDDGSIDLISCFDEETDLSNFKIGLNDSIGYNNGVLILNYICRKNYTNEQLQSKIKVRNINLEDIENHFNPIATNARDAYTNNVVQYDKTKTYSGTRKYPVLYNYENIHRIGISEEYYNTFTNETFESTNDGFTIKQKAYRLTEEENNLPTQDIDNDEVYDMLFGVNYDYWIASRTINLDTDRVDFGIRKIKSHNLSWSNVFDDSGQKGNDSNNNLVIRPIVTLNPSVKIQIHSGSENDMHEIIN